MTPHLRRAYASHLWLSFGPWLEADVRALSALQRSPHLAVVARDRTARSDGAALLFEYLESRWLPDKPGELGSMLIALSGGQTPPGAWRSANEPDLLDVLRANFTGRPLSFPELLGDFAVARAQLGRASSVLSHLAWTRDFAGVSFDWTLPASTLPRRVALHHPVEPSGAVYLWVPLDTGATPATTLAVRAEWDAPAAFQWMLVRIDRQGAEHSRVVAPFQERGTMVEQRIVGLEGMSGLLIAGADLGGVDLAHPFDPDFAPYESTGCTVYVASI
jgi:hypothetical protein